MHPDDVLQSAHTIVNFGADYLTCTQLRERSNLSLRDVGFSLLHSQEDAGNDVRKHSEQGYSGFSTAGVVVAVRADTWLVKVSGEQARLHWRKVFEQSTNVSRLDLQTTVRFVVPQPAIIRELHAEALSFKPKSGRPSDKTLIQSTSRGDTLYSGRRVSDVYCRAYDKGMESKTAEAGALLRYEVEFKRGRARQVAQVLTNNSPNDEGSAGIVSNVFLSRGIRVPASSEQLRLDASSLPVSPPHVRFAWLARAVRPSVQALLRVYTREQLMTCLGLDPPATSKREEGKE
jgi:hypothetical protein